jgi:hypothetical protein
MIFVSYIDAISSKYPNMQVQSEGDGTNYDKLVSLSAAPIPPKAELDAEILAIKQKEMWKDIQEERDARKAGGVNVNNNWFHSDDSSRIQFIALVASGANMPKGIMWKTMRGTFVEMTPQLAAQVFSAIISTDIQIFAKAEQHRMAMEKLEDPAQYEYLKDWPTVYKDVKDN